LKEREEYKYDNISVVLTYPNTDFRKMLLKNCLSSIDTEIIISSHYPIDQVTQEMADWTIYERNNPLLYAKDYGKYNVGYSRWYLDENGEKKIEPFKFEHSYAVYTLVQSGLRYARGLGKEVVNVVNYDYELDPNVLREHEKYMDEYDIVFYKYDPESHPDYANSACTGFFTGKIDVLSEFFEKYQSLDEYYTQEKGWAFFEVKVYEYFSENPNIKVKELLFNDLQKKTKTNQEGLLQFSKRHESNVESK